MLINRLFRLVLVIALSALVGACASVPRGEFRSKSDPWEPMNRSVYSFNQNVDKYFMKPVTETYKFLLPEIVRTGISNAFSNVGDVYTGVNNLLQGKPKDGFDDLVRVFVNSTIGLGGIFDVASSSGMEKHTADFGQTLGVWGVGDGPYMVVPFFGPSNVRDSFGAILDYVTDPISLYVTNVPVRNSLTGVRIVDARERRLGASSLIGEAAFDGYTFLRDAYIQRRRSKIYDGRIPEYLEDDLEPVDQEGDSSSAK